MARYRSGRGEATLAPADIPRPDLARDPGVTARPATTFLGEVRDPRGRALAQEAEAVGQGLGAVARAQRSLASDMLGFGQDMAAIDRTYQQFNKRRQEAEDTVAIDQRQLLLNQRMAPIIQQKLASPDTGNPDFITKLDEDLAKVQAAVDTEMDEKGHKLSPAGKQKYEHAAMQLRVGAARGAAVAANNQRVSLLATRAEENVDAVARMAGANGDVDGAMERVKSSVESMRPVLAPDKFKDFSERAQSFVLKSTIDGHIRRGEIDKAQALVDRYTGFAKPDAGEVQKQVVDAARARGVDPAVALAIVGIESDYDLNARNPKSSASGIYQMTADTARRMGLTGAPDPISGLPTTGLPADVKDQAAAGAALIADNVSALQRGLGSQPTPTDVYLAHFLGAPTAVRALRADPATKITDVLSPAQIEANAGITHNGKALKDWNVGEMYGWATSRMKGGLNQANAFLGGRTVSAADATVPLKDAMALGHTVHNAAIAERGRLRVLINDDVASIQATGQPLNINERTAAVILPAGEMTTWRERREDARAYYDNVHDLGDVTDTEISRRVAALEPVPGEVGFARRAKLYTDVVKVADRHLKLRIDDPAEAVANDGGVKQAQAGFDPQQPATWKPIIDARLAAQDKVGIPEDRRAPITRREALLLTEPLRRMLPGQERAVLTELAQGIQQTFGTHADAIFEYALRANHSGGEVRVTAARIAKKIGLGQPVTRDDGAAADNESEVGAAQRVTGPTSVPPTFAPGDERGGSTSGMFEAPSDAEGVNVPSRAIAALRSDPSKADAFDKKYGKGTAKKILEKYPVR